MPAENRASERGADDRESLVISRSHISAANYLVNTVRNDRESIW